MPRLDGTGPRGEGPMTGRGEGYCAVRIPDSGEEPYGYAGLEGKPVRMSRPIAQSALGARFIRRVRPATRLGRAVGRGRSPFSLARPRHGAGRGRGRRSSRW
jgi:hypothetical protein